MIKITDIADQTGSYWEVTDNTIAGKSERFTYFKDDPIGYDRVRCLRMIVDFYTACGYRGAWKDEGKVFTLNKQEYKEG